MKNLKTILSVFTLITLTTIAALGDERYVQVDIDGSLGLDGRELTVFKGDCFLMAGIKAGCYVCYVTGREVDIPSSDAHEVRADNTAKGLQQVAMLRIQNEIITGKPPAAPLTAAAPSPAGHQAAPAPQQAAGAPAPTPAAPTTSTADYYREIAEYDRQIAELDRQLRQNEAAMAREERAYQANQARLADQRRAQEADDRLSDAYMEQKAQRAQQAADGAAWLQQQQLQQQLQNISIQLEMDRMKRIHHN